MRIRRNPRERSTRELHVVQPVAEIIDAVRISGDAAVIDYTERFDHAALGPDQLRVNADELEASVGVLEPDVLAGLRTAIANVRAVAKAQVHDETVTVDLPEGQTVEIVEHPVRRAAIYVPGGRAPYPSTVVMGAITARAAGVREIVVCAPPGPGGRAHPVILAACVLCEVSEVYRMGGAQGIAALAFGTQSVPGVDVIVGPGNQYVQEAKRQLVGRVGIDGVAGPSELVVIAAGAGAEPEPIALDLMAQAEHGSDSPVWCYSPEPALLDEITEMLEKLGPRRPSVADAEVMLFDVRDASAALARAEEIAPEHLQLMGADAEALADRVRNAGCVFIGPCSGTAFGDYVAGSNHVLPTGGAARFQSGLGPATFRRRMARVSLPPEAAARLAPAGAALARAEGFPVHAESMERRA
jgi:histidinol dehydrogenase